MIELLDTRLGLGGMNHESKATFHYELAQTFIFEPKDRRTGGPVRSGMSLSLVCRAKTPS